MFHVGMLVVCVDDSPLRQGVKRPENFDRNMSGLTRGHVYTVRDVVSVPDNPFTIAHEGVRLVEIVRSPVPAKLRGYFGPEMPFAVQRFRPIDDSRLAIFRKLLAPLPVKEDA